MKVELFFGAWVFVTEIAWIIYGSTFIYEDKDCQDEYDDKFNDEINIDALHSTTEFIVIYGYFLMLGLLLWGLYYLAAYCGWKGFYDKDQKHL